MRALLATGGPKLMRVDGHYLKGYSPYPILIKVARINVYKTALVTNAFDQKGRIYIGQEELKVRRKGNNAMPEQDAVYIGCETDLAAHVLSEQRRQFSPRGAAGQRHGSQCHAH